MWRLDLLHVHGLLGIARGLLLREGVKYSGVVEHGVEGGLNVWHNQTAESNVGQGLAR